MPLNKNKTNRKFISRVKSEDVKDITTAQLHTILKGEFLIVLRPVETLWNRFVE